MKKQSKEKCDATYINGEACVRPKGHWGKHEAGDQHGWLMWTDAGLQRELQGRAAAQHKQSQ